MHIALVTARELPRPDHDLPILVDAFAARGVSAHIIPWEDTSVEWNTFDAAIVRSTWNYLDHLDAFRKWIKATARSTRLINPLEVLEWNLHKSYLLELANAGVPVVATTLVRAGERVEWHAHFARLGDVVVKPAVSAGSFATIRVRAGDAVSAQAHIDAYPTRDFLVQPFLASVTTRGESNMVHFNGRFSHAVRKLARWSGDGEQARGLVDVTDIERDAAARVLACVRANPLIGMGRELAYARVDLALDDQGVPLLMELELVEPSLFLEQCPERAALLVDAVLQ